MCWCVEEYLHLLDPVGEAAEEAEEYPDQPRKPGGPARHNWTEIRWIFCGVKISLISLIVYQRCSPHRRQRIDYSYEPI